MDRLQRVTVAATITRSVVTESRPCMNTSQQVVSTRRNVILRSIKIILQLVDIARCTSACACRMPQRRGPPTIWPRERLVDGVESIFE